MRTRLFVATAFALVIVAGTALTDDKEKKDTDVEKALSKIAQIGPGVHGIKKDHKGRITSCMVVGQARISTVLGKTKGLQTARQQARLAASAEFVKWLKEKVSVHSKSEEETILYLEGSKDNDEEALKESGKAVEKNSEKMESISEGLVRGLQMLHVEVNSDEKTYTIVMGWSAETAKATKKVSEDLKDSEPKGRDAKKPGTDPKSGGTETPDAKTPGKEPTAKKPIDKTIKDKKVTSDDAKKFLP